MSRSKLLQAIRCWSGLAFSAGPIFAPHPVIPSLRLSQLRQALVSDPAHALQSFWNDIHRAGTPLIEPIAHDPRHVRVTFLWRGTQGTQDVVVEPFYRDPQFDYRLSHLENTDVWFTTIQMRAGGRFVYQLGENVPLFPNTFPDSRCDPAQREAFQSAMAPDPLNPRRLYPPGTPGIPASSSFSLVVMPGASPEPWIDRRPNVPAGATTRVHYESRRMGNTRTVTTYTPPGYRTTGPGYPALLIFDEDRYLSLIPAATILDNLIAARRIPPLVLVLIGNPSRTSRNVELPCNPAFADFLSEEFMPWVESQHHITHDPRFTIVAGSSYGGLAAAYVALRHPERFGNVLSQSGSFGWTPPPDPDHPREFDPEREKNYVASLFLAAPRLPVRFFIDVGTEEVDFSLPGARNLIPNRHLRDVLRAKGQEVIYREFIGGHDESSWRADFPEGLIALAGPMGAENQP